ncbi:MAG: protein kinase [Phycisphaerae bacterium]|nr:protein kinase [Phycisphaerae bacterium]
MMDRFTVKQRLGDGCHGTVYLADDALRGEDVAIKVVEVGHCASELTDARLSGEIALHGKLADFRYVLRMHDVHVLTWGSSRLLLLSMEYADGGTFRDWLRQNQANLEVRHTAGIEYFQQVCEGVASAHDAGIVHRDLKPENMLLVGNVLKAADFGAAGLADVAQVPPIADPGDSSPCLGTPTYMSPEQFTATYADEVDHRADIYALGLVLFELVHPKCRPPFTGTFQRLRDRHVNVAPHTLPDAPENVARVVARCLKKNPADRYANVWTLLDDLEGRGQADDVGYSQQESSWKRARSCKSQGDFRAALRHCQDVLETAPDHFEAKGMLADFEMRREQAQQLYATAERDMNSHTLAESVLLVQEAIQTFPNHPAGRLVQARLAARAREYREHVERGAEAVHQGHWEAGLEHLQQAKALSPNAPGLAQAIECVTQTTRHIEETRGYIRDAISNRDRRWALSLARSVDRYVAEARRQISSSYDRDVT